MLENPKGVLSTQWRQPNQRVCPTMFGDKMRKTTCLWTKNLPLLTQNGIRTMPDLVTTSRGQIVNAWHENTKYLPQHLATQIRSQLAPCFARAIATQYSAHILGTPPPSTAAHEIIHDPIPMNATSLKSLSTHKLHIVVQSGGTLNIQITN